MLEFYLAINFGLAVFLIITLLVSLAEMTSSEIVMWIKYNFVHSLTVFGKVVVILLGLLLSVTLGITGIFLALLVTWNKLFKLLGKLIFK